MSIFNVMRVNKVAAQYKEMLSVLQQYLDD